MRKEKTEDRTIVPLSDEQLESVTGGTTRLYRTAVALMNGEYGSGEECRQAVTDMGLDYWSVQHMANALAQGYGQVAQDVIDLKYGNGSARFKALVNAGYDPRMVQQIVNGMLLDD